MLREITKRAVSNSKQLFAGVKIMVRRLTVSKKALRSPSAEPSPHRNRSWYTDGLQFEQSKPISCKEAMKALYACIDMGGAVISPCESHTRQGAHREGTVKCHSVAVLMGVNEDAITLQQEAKGCPPSARGAWPNGPACPTTSPAAFLTPCRP